MRKAGSESWRVSIEDDQLTHAVLFIRDAYDLKPDEDPVMPPRLDGPVPDLSSSLSEMNHAEASKAWLAWWKRVVSFKGKKELGKFAQGSDQRASLRRMAVAHEEVFDPPDFDSLAACPSLHSAARACCEEAPRWHRSPQTPHNPARWLAMKTTAEKVCDTYQVSASLLNAAVIALAVKGTWWCFPESAVLLCSQDVLNQETLFGPLIREAFVQGLGLEGNATGITPP